MLLHIVERERRLDPGEIQIGQQVEKGRQLFEARVLLRDIEHQAAVLPHKVAQMSQVSPHPRRLRPPRLNADLEMAEALLQKRRDLRVDARGFRFQGIDGRVGGQAGVTRSAQRLTDRDALRLGEEIPDGDVERADRADCHAAAAEPSRPGIHLVPQARRVVHRLPGHDGAKPLGQMVVRRHFDRRLDDLGRCVAFANAREPVVALGDNDDVPIAALEAVVGGLRVLEAHHLHPFDGDGHVENVRRA